MQSVLHLQGEPHQHRRADRRHAADPEHSRAQAAEHRGGSRRQQGREDRHRRRHQSTLDRMAGNQEYFPDLYFTCHLVSFNDQTERFVLLIIILNLIAIIKCIYYI